eukprot:scaffold109_cov252-Pinguiococcus_pyrenoidosus.AAC.17
MPRAAADTLPSVARTGSSILRSPEHCPLNRLPGGLQQRLDACHACCHQRIADSPRPADAFVRAPPGEGEHDLDNLASRVHGNTNARVRIICEEELSALVRCEVAEEDAPTTLVAVVPHARSCCKQVNLHNIDEKPEELHDVRIRGEVVLQQMPRQLKQLHKVRVVASRSFALLVLLFSGKDVLASYGCGKGLVYHATPRVSAKHKSGVIPEGTLHDLACHALEGLSPRGFAGAPLHRAREQAEDKLRVHAARYATPGPSLLPLEHRPHHVVQRFALLRWIRGPRSKQNPLSHDEETVVVHVLAQSFPVQGCKPSQMRRHAKRRQNLGTGQSSRHGRHAVKLSGEGPYQLPAGSADLGGRRLRIPRRPPRQARRCCHQLVHHEHDLAAHFARGHGVACVNGGEALKTRSKPPCSPLCVLRAVSSPLDEATDLLNACFGRSPGVEAACYERAHSQGRRHDVARLRRRAEFADGTCEPQFLKDAMEHCQALEQKAGIVDRCRRLWRAEGQHEDRGQCPQGIAHLSRVRLRWRGRVVGRPIQSSLQ